MLIAISAMAELTDFDASVSVKISCDEAAMAPLAARDAFKAQQRQLSAR